MSHDRVTFTEQPDPLTRVTWAFWFYGTRLVLDRYLVETRPTKRHGFKLLVCYARQFNGERLPPDQVLQESHVPLTSDVRERAIREFMAPITVAKWSEVPR